MEPTARGSVHDTVRHKAEYYTEVIIEREKKGVKH